MKNESKLDQPTQEQTPYPVNTPYPTEQQVYPQQATYQNTYQNTPSTIPQYYYQQPAFYYPNQFIYSHPQPISPVPSDCIVPTATTTSDDVPMTELTHNTTDEHPPLDEVTLREFEESIHRYMQPMFDELTAPNIHQTIDDTLHEYEHNLEKEVQAALGVSSAEDSKLIDSTAATHIPGELLAYLPPNATVTPTPIPSPSSKLNFSIIEDKDEDPEKPSEDLTSVMTFSQWFTTICIVLIPILDVIVLCSWACGKGNINRVNFSRAMLLILAVLLLFIVFALLIQNVLLI